MAHLLRRRANVTGSHVAFDVVDIFNTSYHLHSTWVPASHKEHIVRQGKGDMAMAWASNVIAHGAWPGISRVTRGQSTDSEILALYQDGSIDFLYLDTAHTLAMTARELRLWWPKIGRDGWLCGDDFRPEKRNGQAAAILEFFGARKTDVHVLPHFQYCVGKLSGAATVRFGARHTISPRGVRR